MRASAMIVLAAYLLAGCTKDRRAAQPMFTVPTLGLALPKLSGWITDPELATPDLARGGVIFRLVRENPVPLAPRIDVLLEPPKAQPTLLEDFLTQNLREMAQYENDAQVRITNVEQRPASVGPRRAFRVQHEYTMTAAAGNAPIAITQVSTLFVLDGRGVAVTALGRTELFHPLADQIERIMTGLDLPVPRGAAAPPPAEVVHPDRPTTVEPVDLGTIGGH